MMYGATGYVSSAGRTAAVPSVASTTSAAGTAYRAHGLARSRAAAVAAPRGPAWGDGGSSGLAAESA
jgi:hypothetical protein